MGAGFVAVTQERGGEQAAEAGRPPQRLDRTPGVVDKRGGERRRQVARLIDDRAPLREARVLVPLEVVDERIALATGRRREPPFAGEGSVGLDDGRVDRGEQFRELVVLGDRRIERLVFVCDRLVVFNLGLGCVRPHCPPPQRIETSEGQRPAGRGAGDTAARAQHRAGAGQFVGWRSDVHGGVVQHEVFEVDELALEPQRGGGVDEVGSRDPAVADGARSQPLVEPRQRVFGAHERPRQVGPRERIAKFSAQVRASGGRLGEARIAHDCPYRIFREPGLKHQMDQGVGVVPLKSQAKTSASVFPLALQIEIGKGKRQTPTAALAL